MGAIARLFFNERQKKLEATQPPAANPTTDAAGQAFGTTEDPQTPKQKPRFDPEPWQMAERA